MEIQELLPDAPELTDEMVLDIYRNRIRQYLIYRKTKTHIDCFCTSCQKEYRIDRAVDTVNIIHNDIISCRSCGAEVTCKSEGRPREKLYQSEPLVYFCIQNGKVYAFCGFIKNSLSCQTKTIEELSDRRLYWWVTCYVVEYAPQSARLFAKDYAGIWREEEKLYEPWYGSFGDIRHFKAYNSEVLEESFLKYSISEGNRPERSNKPLLYLMYAAKYPAFEMLEKLGGDMIISDIMYGRNYKRVLDLSGKSCAEVFRTDSNEAAVIRRNIRDIDINVLQCLHTLKSIARRQGRKYKLEDAVMICRKTSRYDVICKLIRKTSLTPQKLMNYLYKQLRERKKAQWQNLEITIIDYADYIHECEQLGYNITDEQICKPKKLYAAHERTSAAVNAIERERREREEQERTTAYLNGIYKEYVNSYEYSDKSYSIVVPKSALEIVNEGKSQHHCVAGYADRHIDGKLAILFMRDTANIGTALYTIEMQGDELVQIRGYRNCDPTGEAKKIVDKWLKWVKLPENKKHPRKPSERSLNNGKQYHNAGHSHTRIFGGYIASPADNNKRQACGGTPC